MILKEIILENFRAYRGRQIIDLSPKENQNLILISGNNGYGKTTFLMSIVWCLYGRQMSDVDDLYKKEINDAGGYKSYIQQSLNNKARERGENSFSVELHFEDVALPGINCRELIVKRSYFEIHKQDNVEILIDGQEHEVIKEIGADHFIRDYILPKEVAKFFLFDAEKIVTLAEVTSSQRRKDLSIAYYEVLGINKYEVAKTNLKEYQDTLKYNAANLNEKYKLDETRNEIQKNKDIINQLNEEIYDLEDSKARKKKDSDLIQEKLIRHGSGISDDEIKALRKQRDDQQEKLDKLRKELNEHLEIIPFAISGGLLAEVLEQAKREIEYQNKNISRERIKNKVEQVMTELSNYPKPEDLIIEHRVRRYYEDAFQKLIEKYFIDDAPDDDLPSEIRPLHDFTQNQGNELEALVSNIQNSFQDKYETIANEKRTAQNKLQNINRELSDAEAKKDQPIIAEDRENRYRLEEQIEQIVTDIAKKKSEIQNLGDKIESLEHQAIAINRKLEAAERDREKYNTAERLIKELDAFIKEFTERKKVSLESKILKELQLLMHKQDFVTKIKVEIIQGNIDIRLIDSNGEEIPKTILSMGEKQLFATALLYGLVEETGIDFPLFVDSPLQKLDAKHSGSILQFFYPQVGEQVVLFPLITKEINQNEFNLIKENIAQSYLIEHLKGISTLKQVKPDAIFETFELMNREYAN